LIDSGAGTAWNQSAEMQVFTHWVLSVERYSALYEYAKNHRSSTNVVICSILYVIKL